MHVCFKNKHQTPFPCDDGQIKRTENSKPFDTSIKNQGFTGNAHATTETTKMAGLRAPASPKTMQIRSWIDQIGPRNLPVAIVTYSMAVTE